MFFFNVLGLDTTIESTEGETLLDTTVDTTISEEAEEFDTERYVDMEPLYENIGPLEIGANNEEHIYNEGEVEDYLARKFARSKERFEHLSESGYENLPPAYMAPPPPPLHDINYNKSPTSLHKVQSNYGSYMAMNISNSSRTKNRDMTSEKVPKRHRKHHKVRVKRHTFPSPTFLSSSPKDTFVIDMDHSKYPTRFRSFTGHKHTDPERRRLLDGSPPNFLHISPKRDTYFHGPRSSLIEPHCSYKHSSTNISPKKMSPSRREREASPSMLYSMYGKRRSPQKKSPNRRISPQKTTFKSGVSYECNHAYD